MSYKTILVHLNDERRVTRLLEAAVDVARTFEAHLVGLHVFPAYRLAPPVPLPIGGDVLGAIKAQLREETERIKATFEAMTRNQTLVAEWRSITSERRDAVSIVLEHTRASDLVVASQTDRRWDLHQVLDFPERLALESGRPVLVVPNSGAVRGMPRRVAVAWNDRREAARAVFDALPFLKAAEDVRVLTVDEERGEREGSLPDTEIASALARHGVKVTAQRLKATAPTVGEEIRERALEHHADLLVMGCYGHSRFREFAFGGVTRHILGTMSIPILFSH